MRAAGLVEVCHRRKRRGWRPLPAPHEDLVQRRFTADGPDRLWCTDITEHPTSTGKDYCAAVLDVFTRKIVGWSIADHMRSELVVDALQMAIWRRHPAPGAIVHADRGSQYTSWILGHRLLDRRAWSSREELASAIFEWIEGFSNPVRRHSGLGYRSRTTSRTYTPTATAAA